MGKFLRDADGKMVAVGGSPVLEKTLEKKPRDCQVCGFTRWAKGDKLFILEGNLWVCPDCAIQKGLPEEFHHQNVYAPSARGTLPTNSTRRQSSGLSEFMACMCLF